LNATALQRLRARRYWIVLAATAGLVIGWLADRAAGPLYESRVELTFDTPDTGLNQATEMSAAISAAVAPPDVKGAIERESAVSVRQLSVVPDRRDAVAIEVRAYGAVAAVQDAAGRAAVRARAILSDAASRTRIEQEVAATVPAPIRNMVRPWHEVALRAEQPSTATAIRRRPMIGGLLIGVGLAVFGVFVESHRDHPTPDRSHSR
jgi:hypothetical protein